ncbi:MAG: hypothetical protein KAT39_15290, partial [Alphaproteobacteria bacterium]|nr:hypothetical protein [Alphaproteobacteria bacterium]
APLSAMAYHGPAMHAIRQNGAGAYCLLRTAGQGHYDAAPRATAPNSSGLFPEPVDASSIAFI